MLVVPQQLVMGGLKLPLPPAVVIVKETGGVSVQLPTFFTTISIEQIAAPKQPLKVVHGIVVLPPFCTNNLFV